jgi:hypothetical protein
MTVKEIAELCGVTEQTVLNWTHKFDGSDQKIWSDILNQKIWLRISEKLRQGSPEHPSDFTLEETLAIIGEGGGNKTLASLLADNAAKTTAVARMLQESEQLSAEGAKNMAVLVTNIKSQKYLRAALTGKAAWCRRLMYMGGGRVYAIPTSKCATVFSVLVYDSWGRCLREGFAYRENFYETVEGLVREYNLGERIVSEDVGASDVFEWRAGCAIRKPLEPLYAMLRMQPDKPKQITA